MHPALFKRVQCKSEFARAGPLNDDFFVYGLFSYRLLRINIQLNLNKVQVACVTGYLL